MVAPFPSDDSAPDLTEASELQGRGLDEANQLVYEDLRRIADRLMSDEPAGVTLQPTALVHEAYLNLASQEEGWESRAQFVAVAAKAMRHLLIDAARARRAQKRGGGWGRVTLDEPSARELNVDLLDLDAALSKLGEMRERYARIVELRYFGGLTTQEVADVLGVSRTIVVREWAKAKTLLATLLGEPM